MASRRRSLVSNNEATLEKALKVLETEGGKNGLELSEEKTRILKIRGRKIEGQTHIGKYKIEKEAKYLGVQVGGVGSDIYAAENKLLIQKAEKKASELMRDVKKSCDIILVGKAIWKMMHIPAIMYGRTVVTTSEANITKLQRIENRVWRFLLGIGGYATVEALRGEIGASMVKSRIIETSLGYILDVINSEFEDLKKIMLDSIKEKRGKWYSHVNKYRLELDISWENFLNLDKKSLKEIIKNYDNNCWKAELNEKSSTKYYAAEKTEIGYDFCYKNNYSSKIFARARINALQLEQHKGRGINNYDTTCKLCGEEEEDIVHFTVKCRNLERKRNHLIVKMDIIDPEERMKDLLFRNKNYKETSKVIRDLWVLRRQLLKEKETSIEDQRENRDHNPPQSGLPQSKIIETPVGDTPIVNPPQCGLPRCRIIESARNPPQCGPPQCGLPQCRTI